MFSEIEYNTIRKMVRKVQKPAKGVENVLEKSNNASKTVLGETLLPPPVVYCSSSLKERLSSIQFLLWDGGDFKREILWTPLKIITFLTSIVKFYRVSFVSIPRTRDFADHTEYPLVLLIFFV